MKGVRRFRALVLGAVLVIPGCTAVPELADVTRAVAPGAPGLGAARVASDLARTEYGVAVQRAALANPDLTLGGAGIREALANKRAAEGVLKPEVSVGADAEARSIDGDSFSDASPFVRVSQLIYDAGAARADTVSADARVAESRGRQLDLASAATLEAVETHYNLLSRRDLLRVAEDNLRVLRELAAQIEERVRRGAGTRADALTARSRVADAETRLADAQANLDRAEARYRRLFGTVPARLPVPRKAPPLPSDEAEVVRLSPRIRAADAAVKAAEADLSAARARRLPAMELAATGREANGGGLDAGLDVSLTYSLDTSGELRAAIDAATARLDQVAADRAQLARDVREALAFVRSDQVAGQARLEAASAASAANAEAVRAARAQFSVGRRNMIDLLDAQRDFVRSEEVLIVARQDRFLTDYAALALTGDILDAFAVPLDIVDGGKVIVAAAESSE